MDIFSAGLAFDVRNLGSVRNGSFALKPLTIFCGPNNSGKTWTMYSLYHFFKVFKAWKEYPEEQKSSLNEINEIVPNGLSFLFNTSEEKLNNAEFSVKILDNKKWKTIADHDTFSAFLMPSERSGLHLFFRELSARRAALLHHASRENIDIVELLRGVIRSRYAVPIADYIDWLNDLTEKQKTKSEDFHPYAERLKRDLAGGEYRVDARTGSIEFKPYQARQDGRGTATMGLHMTSSTVKSLFGLWFYLEHEARKGDVLMIDEPELNVHPENQRKIARLLARLVNAGLHIVVSTHSDYIVREINSLIMLDQDKDKDLRKKYGYEDDEILKSEQIGAYLFDGQTIEPFDITPEDGIYATTFDEVIRNLNAVNNDIYYSLQEQGDEQEQEEREDG